MNKTIFAALLATAAVATPAMAQTAPTTGAPVGARAEVLLGLDKTKDNDGFKDSGMAYGVGVGYDMAVSPTMSLGVDAEVADSTAKDEFAPGEEIKAGLDLYAGARASFAVSDTANVYVKGGYTNARFKYDGSLGEDSTKLDGYRVGAGAQARVGTNMYVGGEYRHSNYEAGVTRNQVVGTLGFRF